METREIIFRALTIDTNEWVEGDLIHGVGAKNGRMYILPRIKNFAYVKTEAKPHDLDGYEVQESSISQFTGLTDKNGVRIFEHDIISFGKTKKYYVLHNKGAFYLYHKDGLKDYDGTDYCWGLLNRAWQIDFEVEVIGNIYEA